MSGHIGCKRPDVAERNRRNATHGATRTPEWKAYASAMARCKETSAQHADYFDRGIRFLFTSFEQFFAEVGPRPTPQHSIDRKENDKNYEPGNLRWATREQQARNRRCDNCEKLKREIAELRRRIDATNTATG